MWRRLLRAFGGAPIGAPPAAGHAPAGREGRCLVGWERGQGKMFGGTTRRGR